jgi:hypothetical protein
MEADRMSKKQNNKNVSRRSFFKGQVNGSLAELHRQRRDIRKTLQGINANMRDIPVRDVQG